MALKLPDLNIRDLTPAALEELSKFVTGLQDPQLGYMWEVEIHTPTRTYDYENNAFLYARSLDIPQRSVEKMERRYIGELVSHPGHNNDPKDIQMVFWDDKSMVGYRYFHKWMAMVSDPSYGRQVNPTHYRRDVRIRFLDRTGFFAGVVIDFEGCYITNIGEVSLTYEESTPFIFSSTMHYKKMIINGQNFKINNVEQAQSILGYLSSLGSSFKSETDNYLQNAQNLLTRNF